MNSIQQPHCRTKRPHSVITSTSPASLHACSIDYISVSTANPIELIYFVLLTSVIKPGGLPITYSVEYRRNLSMMECMVRACGKYMFHNGTAIKCKTFHPSTSPSHWQTFIHDNYRVAQNTIPHRRICNISATSGLILKILEAA